MNLEEVSCLGVQPAFVMQLRKGRQCTSGVPIGGLAQEVVFTKVKSSWDARLPIWRQKVSLKKFEILVLIVPGLVKALATPRR